MFATINFNLLMSMALTAGCFVSKAFAASVVAGSFGVFIACVIILMNRRSNQSVL